ncbi:cytochrome c [Sphingobacterium sp. SRCM116780]|uniref:c-type cytochrome n=1 Tax=Sphingobacterium sp. SRCM116780 TaxID=2907623 RepID=UPI001F293817|nr:cytochrome c [Sphingobacterium sp. SRCM116780]UIR54519.1 cytochrome c [Sphingobacterium sp. SRCM116780]
MAKLYILGILISVYFLSTIIGCQSGTNIKTAQYAVNGQKIYVSHCKNCHGAKGEGLGLLYPPLTDINFLTNNRNRLSCIVKNGLEEEIVVSGKTFKNNMPSNAALTAIDIAYVLTYITTNFGKHDKIFSLEEVQRDLKSCK